jgi:CheY-like chemotaxis protein
VARRIRATAPGKAIKLIALTGYGQSDDMRRAHEAGFDLHLVKPVEPRRLDEALRALLPDG